MSIACGRHLGAYEVLSPLGAGGMGEVYRARDTKLRRDVALKILPDLFAADPDRRARFTREAHVLASLNHPNIAAIYGIEETTDVTALVMELVEGATLADRIASGPLPVDEALRIAMQIADGLDAAHEKGIVHRDLKPANIKITDDGRVKVLDFGLAKALTDDASSDASLSPTMTAMASRLGVIVGTAAYMSPEQAKGKPVDKRTDIWAFGCVLFEMFTGQRAFAGDDVADFIAAVMTREPDWSRLPPTVPSRVGELLERCLKKDPRERLRDIGDVPDYFAGSHESASPATAGGTASLFAWAVAAVFAVGCAALAIVVYFRAPTSTNAPLRVSIAMPDGWALATGVTPTGGTRAPLAASPDGRHIVFAGRDTSGRQLLWLRSLAVAAPQMLPGTDDAASPFWSPDSRSIAFFARGKLLRIDLAGGPPIAICAAVDDRGGTWGKNDTVVFAPSGRSPLVKVRASGGTPAPITQLRGDETGHLRPAFLPDGDHLLFTSRTPDGRRILYVSSVNGMTPVRLFDVDSAGVSYSGGYLLFPREATLMARRFDEKTLTLSGEPVSVAEPLFVNSQLGVFSAAASDVLVYQPDDAFGGSRLVLQDANGGGTVDAADTTAYGDVAVSPDSMRAAVTVFGRTRDLWLVDLVHHQRTRFTFRAADTNNSEAPIWSPDGKTIVFGSTRTGRLDLYQKPSDGSAPERPILADELDKTARSWSPDGRFILYSAVGPETGSDLWIVPITDSPPTPRAILHSSFTENYGQFSPDGRWIAYSSDESGRAEVYVIAFPELSGKWQVSAAGGNYPRWRRDGKELFFVSTDDRVMSANVRADGRAFAVTDVRPLFSIHPAWTLGYSYDVLADGRFLVNTLPAHTTTAPLQLVVNWRAEISR